jgi:hypothetical protein
VDGIPPAQAGRSYAGVESTLRPSSAAGRKNKHNQEVCRQHQAGPGQGLILRRDFLCRFELRRRYSCSMALSASIYLLPVQSTTYHARASAFENVGYSCYSSLNMSPGIRAEELRNVEYGVTYLCCGTNPTISLPICCGPIFQSQGPMQQDPPYCQNRIPAIKPVAMH